MNSKGLLLTIAIILFLAWAIGFFIYSAGGIIHILLIIGIIALLMEFMDTDNRNRGIR